MFRPGWFAGTRSVVFWDGRWDDPLRRQFRRFVQLAGPGKARFSLKGEPIARRLPCGQHRTDLGIDGWDGWDVWAEISTIRERPRLRIFRVNGVPMFEEAIDCPRGIEMGPIENRLPRCSTGTTDRGGT